MGKRRKRELGPCSYCEAPATTRDNVPPEGMFPDPKPTDLIRVPACKVCNEGRKLDDEYFRWFVATFSSGSPEATRLLEERMLPRFSRRPALLADVMRKSFKADVYSEGGVYLGTQPAFWYDRARVQRVFESTIRGLYRHEFKERLGASYGVSDFFVNPEIPKAVLAGGEWMPLRVVGGGVFRYRRFRFEEEGIRSGWYLRFFDRLTLLGITGPANELQHGTGWSWPSLAARLHVGRASVRLKAQGGWDVSYPHGQSSEEGTA